MATSTWTDELKAKAVASYTAMEPTAVTTAECVKAVAEELGQSPNGVRMILSKAEVYVKSGKAVSTTATGAKPTGTKAPSKAQSVSDLLAAITDLGQEPDMEVIEKLTGKQAIYFTTILRAVEQTQEG